MTNTWPSKVSKSRMLSTASILSCEDKEETEIKKKKVTNFTLLSHRQSGQPKRVRKQKRKEKARFPIPLSTSNIQPRMQAVIQRHSMPLSRMALRRTALVGAMPMRHLTLPQMQRQFHASRKVLSQETNTNTKKGSYASKGTTVNDNDRKTQRNEEIEDPCDI